MAGEFQVSGRNADALFTLKLHRGDGMTLLAMNWKIGQPPQDFVGFAIEYKLPNGDRFFPLKNRLSFRTAGKEFVLTKPPRLAGETAWWAEDYTDVRKIHDRELFA